MTMTLYHYCRSLVFVSAAFSSCVAAGTVGGKWDGAGARTQSVPLALQVEEPDPATPTEIVVSLYPRNRSELDALTNKILDGVSVSHMSSEEFFARYAPAAEQVNSVVDYLKSFNFKNIIVDKNNLLISANGNVGMINKAFKTGVRIYRKNGRTFRTNIDSASVPGKLADSISAVLGVQAVVREKLADRRSASASEGSVRVSRAVGASLFNASKARHLTEFSAIYNAHNLPPARNTTIGIIADGDVVQTEKDLRSFAAISGFPVPDVRVVSIGAGKTSGTENMLEWNMVTQAALAAAGGTVKQMRIYNVPALTYANMLRAFNQAVTDKQVQVIGGAFGACEIVATLNGYDTAANFIFQAGIVQGKTFIFSAGDTSKNGCDNKVGEQLYPAASPFVIAVGGTRLVTNKYNVREHETAWKFTGGGLSLSQSPPDWQGASGAVPGSVRSRSVPDISFNADPDSGGLVVVNGEYKSVGGAGLSASLFSGFWARIQSAYNNELPFPGSLFYMGARDNPKWFYDVTSGSVSHQSTRAYDAYRGWDFASGFGSLNVGEFAASLRNVATVFRSETVFLHNGKALDGISLAKGNSARYCFHVQDDGIDLLNRYARNADYPKVTFTLRNGKGNARLQGDVFDSASSPYRHSVRSVHADHTERLVYHSVEQGVVCVKLDAAEAVDNASLHAEYGQVLAAH